jgi:TadE-like protein
LSHSSGRSISDLARDERGAVALETTLMIVILIPLLFAIIQFGWLTQRWIAQDGVTVQAARLAGELGGDRDELRTYIAQQLTLVGIEPSRAVVVVDPARVGWREPVRVSIQTSETIAIPFVISLPMTVASTAVARGELQR